MNPERQQTDDQVAEQLIARIGGAASRVIAEGMTDKIAELRQRGIICEGPLTVAYATLFAVTRLLDALLREVVATDPDRRRAETKCAAVVRQLDEVATPRHRLH